MSKNKLNNHVSVIGGGLAGSEATWQLAKRGINVTLYEMRPTVKTPAHITENFAELVCSNSLGGNVGLSPAALLKDEMRLMDSLILRAGDHARVQAGSALAVDRERFSEYVTDQVQSHPLVEIVRQPFASIPEGPAIIATGPLTHIGLSQALIEWLGETQLSFFDAAAPIVFADSVNMAFAFWGSREGDSDYLNCPLSKAEYLAFHEALLAAEQHPLHDFEDTKFFEGCLPIEELARRGVKTPLFGPMKPIGLMDPKENRRPYAVVQLRRDNAAGSLLSLVGFQTNLRWGEQKRVFGMIPALRAAEFARYGVMHRNTYLKSPKILQSSLQTQNRSDLFMAGQMIGVEGYVESAASGMIAGINAARLQHGSDPFELPGDTMLGALLHYVTHANPDYFQPMNANFGLLNVPDEIKAIREKRERRQWLRDRALKAMEETLKQVGEDKVGQNAG